MLSLASPNMKDQCDWVSSFNYGGDISQGSDMALPSTQDGSNLEAILADLRSVGEVEHTFRVVQIGRAMLRRPPPSMASLQLVLRDFYFNYRRYGSPAMSAEHLLTVSSRGLLFTSRDPSGEIEKVNSTRFGPESIVQTTAVRFSTRCEKPGSVKTEPKQHKTASKKPKILRAQQAIIQAMLSFTGRRKSSSVSGRFSLIDKHKFSAAVSSIISEQQSAKNVHSKSRLSQYSEPASMIAGEVAETSTIQQGSQPPWFLMQPEFEFMSKLYHPPIVAFTLRRQHRIRSIDLHVFVCCSDSEAVQLVTFVTALCENQVRTRASHASLSEASAENGRGHMAHPSPPASAATDGESIANCKVLQKNDKNRLMIAQSADIYELGDEDNSYYERSIVKEATIVKKSATLTRTGGKSEKLPFVNPNVELSPFGTLTSTKGRRSRRPISKLATPFVPSTSGNKGDDSSTKPTIYDVVDNVGSAPIVSKPNNSKVAALLAEANKQSTQTVKAIPVEVVSDYCDGGRNERRATDSVSPSYANEGLTIRQHDQRALSDDDIVRATSVANPGELLPVQETASPLRHIHPRNSYTPKSDDDCWSKSEFPNSNPPHQAATSVNSLMKTEFSLNKTTLLMTTLGDVQSYLGYMP